MISGDDKALHSQSMGLLKSSPKGTTNSFRDPRGGHSSIYRAANFFIERCLNKGNFAGI